MAWQPRPSPEGPAGKDGDLLTQQSGRADIRTVPGAGPAVTDGPAPWAGRVHLGRRCPGPGAIRDSWRARVTRWAGRGRHGWSSVTVTPLPAGRVGAWRMGIRAGHIPDRLVFFETLKIF